ncbi:hypothetical protein B5F74_11405 [Collinsella sp. An271]|nr:hypothetical protein B5F74_11405 [Collinsella sp. An271]
MAHDPEALLQAAIALGPMHLSGAHDGDLEGRCFKPSELQGGDGPKLRTPDTEQLLKECYFDPYSTPENSGGIAYRQTGRLARAAATRAATAYSFDNARDYSFADSQYRFLVEPLHDWVFARNLLSIVLRIGGLLRAKPEDKNILESAGFTYAKPKTRSQLLGMEGACYVIPIGFNPFYRKGNIIKNDAGFDANVIWPLYGSLVESRKKGLAGGAADDHLATCPDVKFLTAVVAGQAKGTFAPRESHDLINTWWYLALREGENQIDTANMLLRALDRALFEPELCYTGEPGREIAPARRPGNLLEAMWLLARDHPNRYLLTCENCGRTVLSGNQGGERRFCSGSCRAAWNKEHRGELGR